MNQIMKVISTNRKAEYNYFILDKFIAGIVLTGTEIKSIRHSNVNIGDSYCFFDNNELFIKQMHIPPYKRGNIYNHGEYRVRKLLLNRHELNKLIRKKIDGMSIIPTRVIINGNLVKIEIALAKGKKAYDKREAIKKRDIEREIRLKDIP